MLGSVPKTYTYPGPASIGAAVLERCTVLHTPFVPTPWAPNGHAQSALGARGGYTRQPVLADDGGTLGLDWWGAPTDQDGINGGSHEGYVKWACIAAAQRGWRAVVLNLRGCNGLDVSSPRGYNAIMTHDLHVALCSVARRFPAAPLFAVGYSLGSVLLGKYLAEADSGLHEGGPADEEARANGGGGGGGSMGSGGFGGGAAGGTSSPARCLRRLSGSGLVAAALVSAPVCLHSTNARLARVSPDILYNFAVAYKLREYVQTHLPALAAHGVEIDSAALNAVGWTVAAFDDAVTLRQLGYKDGADYYRAACTTNFLPFIRTPTLLMVSRDDPFLGYLPKAEVQANPFLALAATKKGGHLGFLQGTWPLGISYSDVAVDDWMAAALELAPQANGAPWEARARALGWEPSTAAGAAAALALATARCDCLHKHRPDLAAAQAEAAAASAAAAAASGAAGSGGAAGAAGGASDDGRWRLGDVLPKPPPATGRALKWWAGLVGGGLGGGGGGGAAAAAVGDGGPPEAGGAVRVAVPSTTLEVPSPTLDRRPGAVAAAIAAQVQPTPLSKL